MKGYLPMPLPIKQIYTSNDYWQLPEGQRAELIDGKLYDMAPPSYIHQKLVMNLSAVIHEYIRKNHGSCEVLPAPFAVNLNADDKTYVEPDISVICDKNKLTDKGCMGAPDFVIEIVSPNSRKMDYNIKNTLYFKAGVREYWIVDPLSERTTIYRYEEDFTPVIFPFDQTVPVKIYKGLLITVSELLK
jgi:Uma2 family endonuclease